MKKLISNISWVLVDKIFQIFTVFVITGLLSRELGVVKYGEFQYISSLIIIFSSISFMCGAEVLLPKIVGCEKQKINEILSSGFIVRFISSTLAYILLLVYGLYFIAGSEQYFLLAVMGLSIIFREPFAVVLIYYQSITNVKLISKLMLLIGSSKILIFSVLYALNILSFKIIGYVWLLEFFFIAYVLSNIYLKNNFIFDHVKIFNNLNYLWTEGIKYWFPIMLMYVFMRIDRIIVNEYSTAHDAGVYMAGMQIYDAIISLSILVSTTVAPKLIYKYSDDVKIIRNILNLCCVMFCVGSMVGIFAYFFANIIILNLMGAKYFESINVLKTGSLIFILAYVDAALNLYFIKKGVPNLMLSKLVVVLLLSVPIQYFGVIHFGPQGAHIGIGVGFLVSIIIGFIFLKNEKINV